MKTTQAPAGIAGLVFLGVALAGCDVASTPQSAPTEPTPTLASPVQIIEPDSREDCTTTLGKSDEGREDPDRVTIRCAGKSVTVAGNFRDRYTNIYDPKPAQDIEKVIVVAGEVRVWLGYGDSTCLIIHKPGTSPVPCKPTQEQTTQKQPTENLQQELTPDPKATS